MYWDVTQVIPHPERTLWVSFADGTAGHVKFSKQFFTGVFAPLKDPAFFGQVFVFEGAVMWPGELDIAPDAMYHEIKKHGEWVLDA